MARLIWVGLAVAAVTGGAYYYANFKTEIRRGQDGKLQGLSITPRTGQTDTAPLGQSTPGPTQRAIRIATFNLGGLDETKLANRRVGDVLVRVLGKFDVVAVQDVRATSAGVLLRLGEQINATGRKYKFATGRNVFDQSSAFLFDGASIEIDRSMVQPVEDPQGRFSRTPLVALFRVRGPDPAEAFTFKLVNVHIDPDHATTELDLLDDVYRAVRDDGTEEDDIILLGDFGAHTEGMKQLGEIVDVTAAITGTPTTIEGIRPVDNILFDRRATAEFTGRAEVLDLVREFDLSLPATREVSDHLPVWAEFSPYEGGISVPMAERASRTTR